MDASLDNLQKQICLKILLIFFFAMSNIRCNKAVEIPKPISSVTSAQVFSSDETANSAMAGVYLNMSMIHAFTNTSITTFAGESADELTDETSGNEFNDFFLCNTLTTANAGGTSLQVFWQPGFYEVYSANSIIAGIQASTGMTETAKTRLTGEAKFLRALCYFYLTNLFGDLPLVLSIDFNKTALLSRTPKIQILQQVVSDLLDAEKSLPGDFSSSGGHPSRANKWAAAALLARVYLYQHNWLGADSVASAVIGSGQFGLVPLPLNPSNGYPGMALDSDVFDANSKEAIFQLQSSIEAWPYTTWEGNYFVPADTSYSPSMWLTPQLMAAFEPNDLRELNWVGTAGSNQPDGPYWFPFKYKSNSGPQAGNGGVTENYTLLRLAEQYLIRAEAEINMNLSTAAIADLNAIRSRAGLDSIKGIITQDSIIHAVQHENRMEFFAEMGHRWFDLKRWDSADVVLGRISYKHIDTFQYLYPIPPIEYTDDPNLTQNPGYQQY